MVLSRPPKQNQDFLHFPRVHNLNKTLFSKFRDMMSSCRNIDLGGTSVLDLMPCGCSSTSSSTTRRVFFGKCSKTVCSIGSRSYGNLVFLRRESQSCCRAIPAKPIENALVNGMVPQFFSLQKILIFDSATIEILGLSS